MSHRLALASAALVATVAVALVAAQDKGKTMTALGVVDSVVKDTVSVDTDKGKMAFTTTSKTEVIVGGGGAKVDEAKRQGKKGVKITEAVHKGDQVTVKYMDVNGKMMASEIEVRSRSPLSAQPVK